MLFFIHWSCLKYYCARDYNCAAAICLYGNSLWYCKKKKMGEVHFAVVFFLHLWKAVPHMSVRQMCKNKTLICYKSIGEQHTEIVMKVGSLIYCFSSLSLTFNMLLLERLHFTWIAYPEAWRHLVLNPIVGKWSIFIEYSW